MNYLKCTAAMSNVSNFVSFNLCIVVLPQSSGSIQSSVAPLEPNAPPDSPSMPLNPITNVAAVPSKNNVPAVGL